MAIPIISDLLERLFGPAEDPHSRDDVKRRLQIVLAHDRLALDPQALEMMRQEIIAVVSRYVEVDFESLEFSLATNERVTALTANLPIRRIRPLGRGADQPIDSEEEVEKIELASPEEAITLDAKQREAALKRFEENSADAHPYLDIDRTDLEEEADTDESASADEEESEQSVIGEADVLKEVEASSDSLETSLTTSSNPEAIELPEQPIPKSEIAEPENTQKANKADQASA